MIRCFDNIEFIMPSFVSAFFGVNMKLKKIISSLLLILISAAWGGSFVAQTKGGNIVGPFSFGFLRFLIAGIAILPLVGLIDKKSVPLKSVVVRKKKDLISGGMLCGFFLAGTSAFQQLGLSMGTSSGKAGFLTSCNVIFVPLIGLMFKDKVKANVWLGVGITVVGLYFLCINGGFNVMLGDVLVLICSVMNAARIIAVDRYMNKADTAKLACVQFFSASVILGVLTAIFEIDSLSSWWALVNQSTVWLSLLYAGVVAGAIAFTVQIVAQKNVNATVSSILMSTESVFSVIAGCLIMHEVLTVREFVGCAAIFVAIIIAQLPERNKSKAKV